MRTTCRLLLLLLITVCPVIAQVPTTGRLVGVIRDEAGTPQQGIEVAVTLSGASSTRAPAASPPRRGVTDERGFFVVDQLEPGIYQLTAARAGLAPLTLSVEVSIARAKVVELVLGRSSRMATTTDVPLDQGFRAKIVALIEFELGAQVKEPVVNTREGVLGTSFEPGRLIALPLQGRNYLNILLLQPGTAHGNGGEGFGSFNGGRASSQNFTLDGTENTDADVALPSLFQNGAVALDAIQEYRIVTSNASAEFGRNTGGQVSLFIKRGISQYHGVGYEFFRNRVFDARDYFDPDPKLTGGGSTPPLIRHQFGGNLGGPLLKPHHFFFGSYEGYRNRQSFAAHPRVPSDRFRQQIRDQFSFAEFDRTGFPFEGGGPSPLLTAVLLRGYPRATRPVNNIARSADRNDIGIFDTALGFFSHTDSFIVRTDHPWNAKQQSRIRYALSDGDESLLGNGIPGTGTGKDFRTQNLSIVHTTLVSDRQVNEFRFGFSRNRVQFPIERTPAAIQALAGRSIRQTIGPTGFGDPGLTFASLYPDIGFGADNSTANGFPFFRFFYGRFADFGVDAGRFPQGRARNTFQFGDSYSLIRARHTVRLGADIRRLQQNSVSGYNLRPSFIIPDFSTDSLQTVDRVLGGRQNFFLTQAGQPGGPILRGLRSTEYGIFEQDNLRLTDRLTVEMGLRYEIFGRETEAHDFLSRAVNYRFVGFSSSGTLDPSFHTEPVSDAVGRTVRNGDHNNFGPRLGVAWDVTGDGKMALRAAYGIYYDHIQGSTIFPNQLNPPGVLSFVVPREILDPQGLRVLARVGQVPVPRAAGRAIRPCTLNSGATGFQDTTGACVALPIPLNIIDPNFRDPYVQRWNLTLQRELDRDTSVELSYVGSKGTHLARARAPNLGPFIDTFALASPSFFGRARPNSGLSEVTVQESSASSTYHSLQLQVQRRLSRHLGFQVAYTFSRSLDDVSSNIVDAGTGGSIFTQNSFDYSSERGLSAFHTKHRVAINYVYDLPFGPGRRWRAGAGGLAAKLAGGWSLSGITVFQSGFPLTFLAGVDVNQDGVLNDRPLLIGNLRDLRLSGGDPTQFFGNPAGILSTLLPADSPFFDPRRPPALYTRNLLRPFDPNLLVGRGSLTGPGRNNFDFALRKITPIGRGRDAASLEFRAEFYNLFNHTNFADPDVVITSPQFGQITSTSMPARQLQFALKLSF